MEKQKRTRDIKLVSIGNSKGIRIPNTLIQKYCFFDNSILLEETERGLLIRKRMKVNFPGKTHTRPCPMKKKNGMILMQHFRTDWSLKNLNCKRYEIYFADLNPAMGSEIQKIRPVVIVSQDEMNQYSETVVVCPLTTKLHPQWRSRIQIDCADKKAEIAVDQIRTISKKRLRNRIDKLSKKASVQLRKLITEMYGE